jgi:hypothetical protein
MLQTLHGRCHLVTVVSSSLAAAVSMVDASVLVSDKIYTNLSGLGAPYRFAKPECPSCRFLFATLDLWLLQGMVWVYWGKGSVEEHTISTV